MVVLFEAYKNLGIVYRGCDVQDHLQERHAQLYSTMRYTALDASPALVESQRRRLEGHHQQFRAFAGDASSAV